MIYHVTKRSGKKEKLSFDKVLSRITKLSYGLNKQFVDAASVSQKVIAGIYDGVSTESLDILTSEICASLITKHPDYSLLGSRILISNLHKNTHKQFSNTMAELYENGYLKDDFMQVVRDNAEVIDAAIVYDRDFQYDYFGYKTLEKSYLKRVNGKIVERPQHLLMRVAIGIHGSAMEDVLKTYDLLSQKYFTHATPTLFNAGTVTPTLASCFLLGTGDSMTDLFDTVRDCALISKAAGGIGLHLSNVRATGSHIKGTGGESSGLVPLIKVFEATARYANQGGKRAGAFAVFVEPWHADIYDILDLKKNQGDANRRARDLFFGLWVPDLFMERVLEDGDWTLFDPKVASRLTEVYGEDFGREYVNYEASGGGKIVKARHLWEAIKVSQIETGGPYLLYKDACNDKSNQKNIGVLKGSNLCCEILIVSDKDRYGVCNLASISLPTFLDSKGKFDFKKLEEVTKVCVQNLDKITDLNCYPVPKAEVNTEDRPIGIGVQGLADVFMQKKLPYDSAGARALNKQIFETMYHSALTESMRLAEEKGAYKHFDGSPASQGILQQDMWADGTLMESEAYDWKGLRENIKSKGLRNSLLIALMPTASTSQILGNTESFEPLTSNMYTRGTQAGEFQVVNKHLVKDLVKIGLWNDDMKNKVLLGDGSVDSIPEIPANLKAVYRTVWEISQKSLMEMSADRSVFVDQTSSSNLYVADETKWDSMQFFAWRKGLKTSSYYLRTRPASNPIKYTVETADIDDIEDDAKLQCSLDNPGACAMCEG